MINPVCMFGNCTSSANFSSTVDMIESMVVRCEDRDFAPMQNALIRTYARAAGGLMMLCKHPMLYSRHTWDALMSAADDSSILWAAHVLPLYAIRFGLSPAEAMRRFFALRLHDWVSGKKKHVTLQQATRCFRVSAFDDEMRAGTMFLALGRHVPDMRCISTIYMSKHGISLPHIYNRRMRRISHDHDDTFMDWFISLTHIVCTSLQLMCWARDSKNASAAPIWFRAQLADLFSSNYAVVPTNPSPAPAASQSQQTSPLPSELNVEDWRENIWLPKFGLNLFLPDNWDPDSLTLAVDVQARNLLSTANNSVIPSAVCETFMHTISAAIAQTLCARQRNMQLSVSAACSAPTQNVEQRSTNAGTTSVRPAKRPRTNPVVAAAPATLPAPPPHHSPAPNSNNSGTGHANDAQSDDEEEDGEEEEEEVDDEDEEEEEEEDQKQQEEDDEVVSATTSEDEP
jgi:hypothetical protein